MTDKEQHPEDPGAEISAEAWAERASRLLDSGKIEEARAEATPWLLRISVDGDLCAAYTAAGRSKRGRPSRAARRASAEFFLKLYEKVEDIRFLNAALYAAGSPFVGRRLWRRATGYAAALSASCGAAVRAWLQTPAPDVELPPPPSTGRIVFVENQYTPLGLRSYAFDLAMAGWPVKAVLSVQRPLHFGRLVDQALKGCARSPHVVDTGSGRPVPGVEVASVASLKDPASETLLRQWAPDLLMLGLVGVVPENILTIPELGCINVHDGALPEVPGVDAPWWTLLLGAQPVVTAHLVTPELDGGPTLGSLPIAGLGARSPLGLPGGTLAAWKTMSMLAMVNVLSGDTQLCPQDHRPTLFHRMHPYLKLLIYRSARDKSLCKLSPLSHRFIP